MEQKQLLKRESENMRKNVFIFSPEMLNSISFMRREGSLPEEFLWRWKSFRTIVLTCARRMWPWLLFFTRASLEKIRNLVWRHGNIENTCAKTMLRAVYGCKKWGGLNTIRSNFCVSKSCSANNTKLGKWRTTVLNANQNGDKVGLDTTTFYSLKKLSAQENQMQA